MAPRRKSPQTSTLPASLILTSREEKYFRRYQRTDATVPADRHGLLPTAAEYLAFQCWYKQRDSGYFSDTSLGTLASYLEKKEEESNAAKLCKHPLHPSHWAEHTSCPPCIVELYLRYVDLLKEHLTNGNDTVQQRWGPSNDDPVVTAWRTGKIHLLRAVATIEKWAASEDDWEQRHTEARVEHTKTAKQALQIYHAAVESACAVSTQPVGSDSSSASFTSSTSSVGSPDAKPHRSVSFVEATSFTLGRPPQYFCRRSPRYEAGKYAVAVESNSEDEGGDEAGDDEDDKESMSEDDGNEADSEDDDDDEEKGELNAAATNATIPAPGHHGVEKNALQQQIAAVKDTTGAMNTVTNNKLPRNGTDKDDQQDSSSEGVDSDADSESESGSSSDDEEDIDEDDDDDEEDDDSADDADPTVFEETSFIVFE